MPSSTPSEAALEVAQRRPSSGQMLAAAAVAELHENALLIQLDLELSEPHLDEPVLEALDRNDVKAATEALAGQVDGRTGARAEEFRQDGELQEAKQLGRYRRAVRRVGHDRLGRRPGASLLGGRQRDHVLQGAREDRRQSNFLLGTKRHAHPLGRRGPRRAPPR
jgi:hypothetical protein